MNNKSVKRLTAMLLCLMLAVSGLSNAYADEYVIDTDTADTKITLTTQGASFSATVPTVIPFMACSDGTVILPGCLKVMNRTHGQIAVKKMVVELPEGWEYSSAGDASKSSIIRLSIQGKDVPASGDVNLENFEVIDGKEDLGISVTACADGKSIGDGQIRIAKAVMVLSWNRDNNRKGEIKL